MNEGSNLSWQGTKRKAVNTEWAGSVCECMGQCTLEGSVQGGEGRHSEYIIFYICY